MTENDFGTDVIDDTDVIEDVGDIETDDTDDVVTDADNPWGWAEGQDPEKIRKTWEKFTPEWERIKKMEEELTPFRQMAEEIQGDPNLQALLRNYYANGADEGTKTEALASELEALKNQMTIKDELGELRSMVEQNSMPEFDQRELLEFAAKGGYPNLETAYKMMKFDEIRQASEDSAYENVKKSKGASVPKVNSKERSVKRSYTEADLAAMSDEDFIKNYDAISKSMARGL